MSDRANEATLAIRGLSVTLYKDGAHLPVLRDMDLTIEDGQVLGLLGESGCGKSMTALAVMGLLPEGGCITAGSISFQGKDVGPKLRGKHMAMIFQEPMTSLNPLLTIGRQLGEVLYYHEGLRGKANHDRCLELLALVNIPDGERIYKACPFKLSGGMRQRVMIALAVATKPELIIADEPTTALDVTTQAGILELFSDLRHTLHSSFLFISHDLGVIGEIADRAAVMYAGYVVEECSMEELFDRPLHPYTNALMRSRLGRTRENRRGLYAIPGTVPPLGSRPAGCPFAPRCEYRQEHCAGLPPLTNAGDGRKVRCWRIIHD